VTRVGELERVLRLARIFDALGTGDGAGVALGIGDDAAVLLAGDERLVWTVDTHVEDVHFRREWLSWKDLGYRSFVAAASDVSAMGGSPWCALSALSLDERMTDEDLDELTRGQKEAADAALARVVGGNLSRGALVTVTTTVLGKAERPLTRSGAKVGDGLWVAGGLGLAAAGLRALEQGARGPEVDAAIHAWRRPRPRVAEGLAMAASANAAIDVSDGLAIDVGRLANASSVTVVLDRQQLLSVAGALLERAAAGIQADAFELILGGGEDYALVAASPNPIAGFARIGEIRSGHGVIIRNERGEEERLAALPGFDHFR
jgi:thiamine-monophosphate kinase